MTISSSDGGIQIKEKKELWIAVSHNYGQAFLGTAAEVRARIKNELTSGKTIYMGPVTSTFIRPVAPVEETPV